MFHVDVGLPKCLESTECLNAMLPKSLLNYSGQAPLASCIMSILTLPFLQSGSNHDDRALADLTWKSILLDSTCKSYEGDRYATAKTGTKTFRQCIANTAAITNLHTFVKALSASLRVSATNPVA